MRKTTASSNRATSSFSTLVSEASRRVASSVFVSMMALAILSCPALLTSAIAEVLTEEPPPPLPYTSYAHLAVTALACVFAMRLAATAFARPQRALAEIPTGPRYLTSPGHYLFGLAVFMALTAFIFLILVYLHKEVISVVELIKVPFLPDSFSKQVLDAVNNESAPYLLIVFFIAALYLYLLHKEAEWNILLMLRDVIHIWIAIPTRVRSIVAQMMVSFAVPNPFAREIVNAQVGVRKEDFEKDPTTFERQWAELSYIQLWLARQLGSGEAGFFDDAEFKLDALLAEYAALSAEVVTLREDPSSHAGGARALVPRAKALRSKLARIVGCYLVHQNGVNERRNGAAKEFGLPVKYALNENPLKYIVIYLIALALCVYIGVYVSAIAFDLLAGKPLENALSTQDDELVWRWISYSSANYGLAIGVILVIRYVAWTSSPRANAVYLWTYCWTGLVAGLVGPLGLTHRPQAQPGAEHRRHELHRGIRNQAKMGSGSRHHRCVHLLLHGQTDVLRAAGHRSVARNGRVALRGEPVARAGDPRAAAAASAVATSARGRRLVEGKASCGGDRHDVHDHVRPRTDGAIRAAQATTLDGGRSGCRLTRGLRCRVIPLCRPPTHGRQSL
jgi:hypothetical protein